MFKQVVCPRCHRSVKLLEVEELGPSGCPSCLEAARETEQSREQTRSDSPEFVTSGVLAELTRNVATMSAEQGRLDAKARALSGDVADLRRAVQAALAAEVAP
ncbi:MAG: hypothetical protein H0X67_18000 [Acidobacteria bacterium]|nr:hypothetical protein [Acidobacteriota bacterium]